MSRILEPRRRLKFSCWSDPMCVWALVAQQKLDRVLGELGDGRSSARSSAVNSRPTRPAGPRHPPLLAFLAGQKVAAPLTRPEALMNRNEGTIDRGVRIAAGLALLSLIFVGPHTWLGLVGLVPLVTGLIGFCPLYRVLGMRTCPANP